MNRKTLCALFVLLSLTIMPGAAQAQNCSGCPASSGQVSCLTVEQLQSLLNDLRTLKSGYGMVQTALDHSVFTAKRIKFRTDCQDVAAEFLVLLEKARFHYLQKEYALYSAFLNDSIRLSCLLYKSHVGREVNI